VPLKEVGPAALPLEPLAPLVPLRLIPDVPVFTSLFIGRAVVPVEPDLSVAPGPGPV
jgi:hypothetical protein